MNKDPYINKKIASYALRLLKIFENNPNQKLYEFIHEILSEDEVLIINEIMLERVNDDFIKQNTLKEPVLRGISNTLPRGMNRGKRRRKERYHLLPVMDQESENFLDAFREEINNSLLDASEWSKLLQIMYLSSKEITSDIYKKLKKLFLDKMSEEFPISPFEKNLYSLSDVFNLDENEIDLITFFFLVDNDPEIEDYFTDSRVNMDELVKSVRLFCPFFNLTPKELKEYFSKDSKLIKSGLLLKNRKTLQITKYVVDFLAGISSLELTENFIREDKGKSLLKLSDHIVTKENTDLILNILNSEKGANLLIYGKPGTGKTQFARSLGDELEKKVFFVNQHDENGNEDLDHRKSAIIAAQNIIDPASEAIIVIDECDDIINASHGLWMCEDKSFSKDQKAWINDLLESTQHKIIWISNRTQNIDDSTKRRFSYTQEFKNLTSIQREKVWQIQLQENKFDFLTQEDIKAFAGKYSINAGGIALALKDIKAMKSLQTKEAKIAVLDNILLQHEKFVFGKQSKLNQKSSLFDLSIVSADSDLADLLSEMKSFDDYLQHNIARTDICNMSLLFQGPPGTGKTEFVKHMAETLGKDLMVKRLSDIRSKWYGESLKNIAAMFEEAQEKSSILLLDEADSFFTDREGGAKHGVDETNELLTQMENFKGILVCSTNLFENMDQAVMRRFNHKVKFGYMKSDSVFRFFSNQLLPLANEQMHQEHYAELAKLQFLTPGDFKVVWQKNYFKKPEAITISSLINQLKLECEYKKVARLRVGL